MAEKILEHDHQHRITYYETDQMGYVHNSNYFRFFEIGREETMRYAGVCYGDMEKQGVMMPLITQYARYHTPALYDDIITIRTTIAQMPAAKIHFDYKVLRIDENGKETLLCEGWNELCFVDRQTRKPMRCPKWVEEKLQKVLPE
mgnify:FL=1